MRIVLQKFFVVVRLDHEGVDLAQPLDHRFRGVTEIGDKPERARAGMKRETHRIDRIVRHRKRLDMDIADRKIRSGPEQPPVSMPRKNAAADRFRGEGIAVDGNSVFPAEHFEPANVIAMFVREENAIELARGDSALFEPQDELTRAQSTINEQPAMIGRDKRAISGAAAAEHGETEHVRLVADAIGILKQNWLWTAQ